MNPTSLTGAVLVTFSLLSYGIASISIQRFKMATSIVLWFLIAGVFLDISATCFMIIGSQNTPFTLHGFLGYSALTTMIVDLILIWMFYKKNGLNAFLSKQLLMYSKFAYGWWVIAYITGSLLVIF